MANFLTPFPRIFISHSTKDNDFGLRLASDLRQIIGNHDAVWFDASGSLQGGDIWWSKIVEELTTRDVFIILLSPDAMTSDWVLRELNMALVEKKHIVPLLYKSCDIRADLKTIHYISFLSSRAYEDAFNELLAVLMDNSQLSQQVLMPKTRRNSAIASHRQGFYIGRTVLLIGLVLLVIASSVGIFAVYHANQLATLHATATAQANTNGAAPTSTSTVPTGVITDFPIPTSASYPLGITAGPDGNLWFTEQRGDKIGRITPGGSITEFPIPTSASNPYGITAGPDHNLWFTEDNVDMIGRITSGK